MQFNGCKIYVNNYLGLNKIEVLNDRFFMVDLGFSSRYFINEKTGYASLEDLRNWTNETPIYILDTADDLADFINGKRDFPIFKTDEEEQKEKEEAEKPQECDSHTNKLDKLRDVIDCLFDDSLEKEGSCCRTDICKGHYCPDSDYDCRNCLMDYIQRIVA